MKKLLAIALCAVFVAGLSACTPAVNETTTGASFPVPASEAAASDVKNGQQTMQFASVDSNWKLENQIDRAPTVFEGVLIDEKPSTVSGTRDQYFSVSRVYRGKILAGEVVNVVSSAASNPVQGSECLILAEPMASVYSNKQLYYSASILIVKGDDGSAKCEIDSIDGRSYAEITETVALRADSQPYTGDDAVFGEYCSVEDIDAIIDFSELVAIVRPVSVVSDINDRTSYCCETVSVLKGRPDNERLTVAAFKNAMQLDKEYVVLLSKHTEKGDGIYMMSSQHSLIEAGSTEAKTVLNALAH